MSTPTRSRRRHERASQSDARLSTVDTSERTTGDDVDQPNSNGGSQPSATDVVPESSADTGALTEHAGPFWAIARSDAGDVRRLDTIEDVKAALASPSGQVWIDLVSPEHDLLAE